MFLDLEKGMSLDLAKDEVGFKSIDVGINWGKINKKFLGIFGSQKDVDLDLSAILYDKNHKVINVVYYRKLRAEGIRHSGDDLVGDSIKDAKDNENISIDFTKLNPAVAKIGIVLVSFRGQPFDDVPYAQIRIYDKSHGKKEPFMQTDIKEEEKFNKRVSLIFGVLSKETNIWSYRNISEPTEKSKLEELYKEVAKHL